jgi:hypothetical protein
MDQTDYPYSEFLPSKGTVVQIDERPQALGRRCRGLGMRIGQADFARSKDRIHP